MSSSAAKKKPAQKASAAKNRHSALSTYRSLKPAPFAGFFMRGRLFLDPFLSDSYDKAVIGASDMNSFGIQHPEIDGAACLPHRSIGCSPFMSKVFNE